jgi:class 3 adenylate cyclase
MARRRGQARAQRDVAGSASAPSAPGSGPGPPTPRRLPTARGVQSPPDTSPCASRRSKREPRPAPEVHVSVGAHQDQGRSLTLAATNPTGPGRASRDDASEILAAVVFIDIVESTRHVAELGDRRWRAVLLEYQTLVRAELRNFDGREVKTIGDAFLVLFDRPTQGIWCVSSIRAVVPKLQLDIRAGIHAGEVELSADDVYGLAVHIGERICALAEPREILVSRTVRDLVSGGTIHFVDRGLHTLKGVPGRWRIFAAEPWSAPKRSRRR